MTAFENAPKNVVTASSHDLDEPCILPLVGAVGQKINESLPRLSAAQIAAVVQGAAQNMLPRLAHLSAGMSAFEWSDESVGQWQQQIGGEIEALSCVITQLVDLVAPDQPAAGCWVSPREVIEEILAPAVRSRSHRRLAPLAITIDVPQDHAIHTDSAMVQRIFQTLLRSALEAVDQLSGTREVPQSREVVVTSVDYADAIEIEIADSGSGLSKPTQAWLGTAGFSELFDENSLAVAAASTLVKQLGGTLCACNCPEGGTAYTIRLPHRRAKRMAA